MHGETRRVGGRREGGERVRRMKDEGRKKKGGGRQEIYDAVNITRRSRKRGRKERGMERKGKRVLFVFQSVPGWLAENSGHVRSCETF